MGTLLFELASYRTEPLTRARYTYKNIPSNGGFFQLAARLARYTGNDTYAHWAEKSWDWITSSVLYEDTGSGHNVYDGAEDTNNCQKPNKAQYSYNYGILIGGCAYMYNYVSLAANFLAEAFGACNC